jgi:hypothetical protein
MTKLKRNAAAALFTKPSSIMKKEGGIAIQGILIAIKESKEAKLLERGS